MKSSLWLRSTVVVSCMCLLSILFAGCSRHPESDAALQKRLVGTWRFQENSGAAVKTRGEMVFTVTTNGGYTSKVTNPQAHTLAGTAEVKNGLLILTATNIDNATLSSPAVDQQTIVRFDDKELVVRSEGSTVENIFRRDTL